MKAEAAIPVLKKKNFLMNKIQSNIYILQHHDFIQGTVQPRELRKSKLSQIKRLL